MLAVHRSGPCPRSSSGDTALNVPLTKTVSRPGGRLPEPAGSTGGPTSRTGRACGGTTSGTPPDPRGGALLARSRQRQTQRSGQRRTNGRQRTRPLDNEGLIPILARAVREIESAVERGQATSVRSRFQAVALLAREERARVRTDTTLTEAKRDGELKRLDGIATILAQTAAREPSLFTLLSDTAKVSDQASEMRRAMLERAGLEVEEEEPEEDDGFPLVVERRRSEERRVGKGGR